MIQYVKNTNLVLISLVFALFGVGVIFSNPMTVEAQQCFINPSNPGGTATSTTCPSSLQSAVNQEKCFFASLNASTGQTGAFRENTCPSDYVGSNTEPKYVPNDCNGPDIKAGEPEGSENHCGILDYLVIFINVLSGLVGIVVVGSIIYGGIQYSSAGSDPQKVSEAKNRIRNALIALFFFLFMYSFLNYLVPGGVL